MELERVVLIVEGDSANSAQMQEPRQCRTGLIKSSRYTALEGRGRVISYLTLRKCLYKAVVRRFFEPVH
jgi:hypothetical protein